MPKVIGVVDGSPTGEFSLQRKGEKWTRRKNFSHSYYVLADDTSQGEDIIVATPGIPPLFSLFQGAYCNKLRPKEETTVNVHPVSGVQTILWIVQADFTDEIPPDQDKNPNQKRPVVRWYGETEEELLEKDAITNEPIQTEALEPILITTPVVLPVLEITRYELWPFDPDVMLDYAHHTNSHVFWGAPEGSALMLPMSVDEETIQNVIYNRITYRIKFRIKKENGQMIEDTWKSRPLHHGFKKVVGKDGNGKKIIRIHEDEQGNPMTVNLKTEKQHAGQGGEVLENDQAGEFLEFNKFPKVNFNALTLGPF